MSADKNRPVEEPAAPDRRAEAAEAAEAAVETRQDEPAEGTARRSLREERPLETDVRDKVAVEPAAKEIVRHADQRALKGDGDHYVRGVREGDLVYYVDGVLDRQVPNVETKYPGGGRAAHWDPDKDALVIEDGDRGTVFTPKNGRDYFDDL
ncbi:hypothetical protein ABZ816_30520 [Actinosynnema sp. NPDC047251]|uniref:Uncharacterized protein n=1 Tax=Saccharothrix espanaensis (strain ATCC 51144 / DSM 44229 / JCM 9112 / NBRC 15066 / NRRL 15764) TaxID=1179773 RepID=K0K562_SACES|nr:hypothetical protein [Saccharothrix espanaensis]CCH32722.1 hypothetical protein BN6_54630 [Saccharothrix espanaensis DSM 44229]